MLINTFITKSSTVIESSTTNTTLNPVTELYYGKSRSFFIFDLDLSKYHEMLEKQKGNIGRANEYTHKLKLFNTGGFAEFKNKEFLFNEVNIYNKTRTASFDLILFRIPETLVVDYGKGFSYKDDYSNTYGVNWYQTKNTENDDNRTWDWDFTNDRRPVIEGDENSEGAYINHFLSEFCFDEKMIREEYEQKYIIGTQHFDRGDEDLEIDLTDFINEQFKNGNYDKVTLGLSFSQKYLAERSDNLEYAGFFTDQSKTYFQPYLQTNDINPVKDIRNGMIEGQNGRIYLYLNIKGVPMDSEILPTCIINDIETENSIDDDSPIDFEEDIVVRKERKGVYSALLKNESYDEFNIRPHQINTDVWKNIQMYGREIGDIEQTFTVDSIVDMLTSEVDTNKTVIEINNLKYGEEILSDEVKTVKIYPRVKYSNKIDSSVSEIRYDIHIEEGGRKMYIAKDIIMDRYIDHYRFEIDGSSFVPHKYYITIHTEKGIVEKITHDEEVVFVIKNHIK